MADVRLEFEVPSNPPSPLPVMALRRGVQLPGATRPFLVGRARSLSALAAAENGLILVAVQREPVGDPSPSDLLSTAVLARIVQRKKSGKNRAERVMLQGLGRVSLTGFPGTSPHLLATYTSVEDVWPDTADGDAMHQALREAIDAAAESLGQDPERLGPLNAMPPGLLTDAIASLVGGDDASWLQDLLSTHDPMSRAEKVLTRLIRVREAGEAKQSIKDRVQNATRDQQREFFLRQQLNAIREELGEGEGGQDDLQRLRERLEETDLPEEVREVVNRELRRLERLGSTSPERSVAVDWLEWIADMPWQVMSGLDVDLEALEQALDHTHYGLDDVKKQVVEHLAVRKLAGSGRADVLLLVGPPGVGKTSIGQAIADATGRKLVRVALGGVRDESELRGHRRTYIGARPGRLVEGLRRAGTADPVVLLDEVDKLGTGHWGDPAAALLEILDPEQNHAFTDRYLEVPFDLSKALFVATANDLSRVPGPLRDRMQVLTIAGYTRAEKGVIARNHLLTSVAKNAGLASADVSFTDEAIDEAIAGWTREAGVRELQRVLGKIYRAAAVSKARGTLTAPLEVGAEDLPTYLGRRKFTDDRAEDDVAPRPGLATGLAWTPVGGSVLYIEASHFAGKGQLILTGQLGDVMKESARAALTYVLSNADAIGVDRNVMNDRDLHIHVPAGGVPKDGPSAGVTMFTALASLLSGRTVRTDVAMTGEATLRGRVLPVGGIKTKVLAAHRHGVKRVILPSKNARDLDDVPDEVKRELEFVLVNHMDEVLAAALQESTPVQDDESAVAA
jgi:ATP-dependent Lon protease